MSPTRRDLLLAAGAAATATGLAACSSDETTGSTTSRTSGVGSRSEAWHNGEAHACRNPDHVP